MEIMKYTVILHPSEEGYAVSVPGLPGCWSQGQSEQEALENIEVVAELTQNAITPEVEVAV